MAQATHRVQAHSTAIIEDIETINAVWVVLARKRGELVGGVVLSAASQSEWDINATLGGHPLVDSGMWIAGDGRGTGGQKV